MTSTSSRRAASQSSSVTLSTRPKCDLPARLNSTSIRPNSLIARSTSRVQSAGSLATHGWSDTISPPADLTSSSVSSAGSTAMSQPTISPPSRPNVWAVARPMLPPVPVTTQTLPETLDAGAMRSLRAAADRVGDIHDVVAVFQSLDGREREADLRVEAADDQSLPPGSLHRLAESLVLERVH